ncbi:MAG: S8 family serine peptidase [candidate division Zixibacteria bacterium]|nr:S8 family serine peptidase [candidate division Zixibacteria bacterium]
MKILRISLVLLLLAVAFGPAFGFSGDFDNLKNTAVIRGKPENVLTERAVLFLEKQTGPTVKIWVFFNDKGIFDKASFNLAAADIKINDHTRTRRAKMGIEGVVFADLPVNRNYIDEITRLGAVYRRSSRWLNAASFEVTPDLLDNIAALSFVNRIQPVAAFKPRPEIVEETELPPLDKNQNDNLALDYGYSYTQVQMINIPAVHDSGYYGQGVIVCLMDGGFRKSHIAFDFAYAESRVLDEYDFVFNDAEVQNEAEDDPNQHNHGTYCWSTLGGYDPGNLIGPAYGSSFLLAKTEDIRSETPVEEDNWVAALEWADSLGADVTSTSLGYSDWYDWDDFDGLTAVITLAANTAASLGIVTCNSAGNSGPSAGTVTAPADAFDILAVGAVNSYEDIAGFSSRGPTADGRLKPEVCAMGVNTYCAHGTGDSDFTYKNGTSLSCPLAGGAAAVLLSARPELTPWQVRKALMKSGNRASSPDNTYGYGIIDVLAALDFEDVCGDVNDDGSVDIADLYYLTAYLYEDGPRPPFTDAADVDSLYGVTNNDAQYLADYLFYDGTLPNCLPYPDSSLPVTEDTLKITNTKIFPGQSSVQVELTLKAVSDIPAAAFPFFFSCSTTSISLDSISFTGSAFAAYTHKYASFDAAQKKGVIGFVNSGESIPSPGENLLASLYFSLTPSTDTHYILIDTTAFGPVTGPVFSRTTSKLEAIVPVIEGLDAYIDPVIHVMTTGSDETGDGNVFNPYATIQKAVNMADDGDTIMVYDGVYQGAGNAPFIINGKQVTVMSRNGPEATVIDGQGTTRAIEIRNIVDINMVIDGFTIRNCYQPAGGGMLCEFATVTIKNCVFTGNTGWGGALYCNNASPRIINCTFVKNASDHSNQGGAIFCLGATGPEIVNCIFAFNAPGDAIYCLSATPGPQLYCCDVYGNEHGDWTGCIADQGELNNNISMDPFFCDTANDDFNIRASSPCAEENNDCGFFMGALWVDTSCHSCCIDRTGNADCSAEEEPDITDITRIIDFLYLSHEPLCCPEETDTDGSYGPPDISDITRLIDYLYLSHRLPEPCK